MAFRDNSAYSAALLVRVHAFCLARFVSPAFPPCWVDEYSNSLNMLTVVAGFDDVLIWWALLVVE